MNTHERMVREAMSGDMTAQEAIELAATDWWKSSEITAARVAWLQLNQERLCMDMTDFCHALETLLARSVWTHELADREALVAEAISIYGSDGP